MLSISSQRQAHSQPPSVLQRLYPGISSLREALLKLAGAHGLHEQLEGVLVRPGDPTSYSEGLLHSTLVHIPANAPPLPERFTLQQQSTQTEVR